jgi:polysaccharide deacetylase family protein (PEP-CTERM system associated)
MRPIGSKCVFSIDVEDWFHILDVPSAPDLAQWGQLPSRVESNFLRLLDIAAEYEVSCTCFFVGWIARRYPALVRAAQSRGHEIASHGWAHRLAYEMTPAEFYQDASHAKDVLEQISGTQVLGYRSAGFSLTANNTWVFDELLRAGYQYDASVFPARRAQGGWENGHDEPYVVNRSAGNLVEFPMTTAKVLGQAICFFGGGYLRLFPLPVIMRMTDRVLREGRSVIFYVHPREIDPAHPRLAMSAARRFRTYVNLGTTEAKVRRILQTFEFNTLASLIPVKPADAAVAKSASELLSNIDIARAGKEEALRHVALISRTFRRPKKNDRAPKWPAMMKHQRTRGQRYTDES